MPEVLIRSANTLNDFLALRADAFDGDTMDYEGPPLRVELACGGLHVQSIQPTYLVPRT